MSQRDLVIDNWSNRQKYYVDNRHIPLMRTAETLFLSIAILTYTWNVNFVSTKTVPFITQDGAFTIYPSKALSVLISK